MNMKFLLIFFSFHTFFSFLFILNMNSPFHYSFLLFVLLFFISTPLLPPYVCQANHFCNLIAFVTQVTSMVPISLETWSLSLAKYLELQFYGGSFNRRGMQGCTHSLHHDHFQYFGYKNQVAVFK